MRDKVEHLVTRIRKQTEKNLSEISSELVQNDI